MNALTKGFAACLFFVSGSFAPLYAQSPVQIDSIAQVSEIESLIAVNFEKLKAAVEKEDDFEKLSGKVIREKFGVLSVLGQSLAEHSGKADSKINGPALRDAALSYNFEGDFAQAQAALAAVDAALKGEVTGEHEELYPWDKLIHMYPMMEVMNGATSDILKVIKRPRGKEDETHAAVTWALLSIAMQVDSHAAAENGGVEGWVGYSEDFRSSALKLAEAIRKKDAKEARTFFDAAKKACDDCHGDYQ
ncbi:hypothetical protein SH668x_003382 [Planctomicrobium sp. SH668]|uniref:hypothetical protein n=1 Tax=Planctomicrobium sp. SH668 TaxID=3448126 RepID=UPI003F5B82FE